ncbi:putative ADP-ribosylation factor-like protein 13B [Apostichopus japonicus]|uniref:Putative ADP-ribosylation factor-like protein 13B n=1 Tax=Stichopus japonicus TaxID=307972 RepID=A0A2G8L5P6_STIJA|nr:putative ADP-ribosylation factor-like protein 13B [Apostichopus japonicus]
MACCCSCFRKKKNVPRRNVTLLLVGLDNAGKTTALKGIQGEPLDDIAPTLGYTYVDLQLDNFDIKVFDLGGGKRIRGIWKSYYAEVHGVIFVIDASAEDRLTECQETLQMVLNQDYVKGKRVLILANKQDKEGALDEIDICDQLDLETMVNQSKCPCRVETCSAIQGSGKTVDKSLREGFRWLLKNISSDYDDIQIRVEKETALMKEAEQAAKKERLDRARKARDEREKREAAERKARGEIEEEPQDEDVIDGDPFKKVDDKYFKDQENKRSEKKSRKKEKNGAVVVGVEESKEDGQKSNGHNVKNGDQTFANEGFQADENDRRSDSSPR